MKTVIPTIAIYKIKPAYFLMMLLMALLSCKAGKQKTLFELQTNTGINFINMVEDGKQENAFQYRNFYNGGGVATGDLNNDSLPDVIFTSNTADNKIYLNQGNFTFKDITATAGINQKGQWNTGVSLVDINNDGWLDIYICSSGHVGENNRCNRLYISNGNASALAYREAGAEYGLNVSGYCTQAAFFDYDMDGDLDCFIINNTPIPFGTLNYAGMRDSSEIAWNVPEQYKGGANHLYQNNKGYFTEVTKQAGLHTSLLSFGLGLSVADINNDGLPDVYVGNDFLERDYLYINQGNGTFKDECEQWLQHISMSSMGTDIADINNDGYPDIYTTDMFPDDNYRLKTTGTVDNFDLYRSKIKAGFYHQYVRNCLQLNNRQQNFIDIANYSGVAATDWSWGLLLFDADNDGFNDIYVCNGINRDLSNLDFLDYFSGDFYNSMLQAKSRDALADSLLRKIPRTPLVNKFYHNNGQLKFTDRAVEWGAGEPSFSNTVAYADFDNDGDLDFVVNNENQPAFVYKNNSSEINANHFIGVCLKGDSANLFAIGSKIRVYTNGQVISKEVQPVRGFQSSVEYKQVIGLGQISQPDSMVITWPDGAKQIVVKPSVNQHYNFLKKQINTQQFSIAKSGDTLPLFTQLANNFQKHIEDDYVDFYYERNVPRMLSREGPKATVADVNNDGLDDVFIGGAAGQEGKLYFQKTDGEFIASQQQLFPGFADAEDNAVLFFDADNDGDKDLFVGPGGNNKDFPGYEIQFRLYLNDGAGNFILTANALPVNTDNLAVAIANDINHDGFQDLFVGARSVPKKYGVSPMSRIFINDGKGHFKDETAALNKDLARIGMVTSAVFADVNNDNNKELIIAGEWMYPAVFEYKNGVYTELQTTLTGLNGWWQSMAAADVNGDGNTDLVIGNIGENFYLQPGINKPAKLWINDFDNNGTLDKIITSTINGEDMPVFLKHEMEEQVPSLKKQSLHHSEYAVKTIQQLFEDNQLAASQVKQFNYTSSVIAFGNGKGNFKVAALPAAVQLSSVNALQLLDVNGDGAKDIIAAGNLQDFLPLFGRLDGLFGAVLLNNGQGDFNKSFLPQLMVKGQTRDLQIINVAGNTRLLFLRNDDYPVTFQLNNKIPRQK